MKHIVSPVPDAERTRRASRAGFSMIEMLAALAIAGAVIAVVSEFAGRAMRNWNRGEATIAVMEMVTRATMRLSTDLSSVLPMTAPEGEGTRVYFSGGPERIQFAAVTGFSPGSNGIELIDISAVRSQDDTLLVRRRGPMAFPAAPLGDPVALARGRFQVRFSYGDRDGRRVATWVNRAEFPTSVVVEFLTNTGEQVFASPFVMPLISGISVDCLIQSNDGAERPRWCDTVAGAGQQQQPQAPASPQTPGQPQPQTSPRQNP